MTTPTAGPLARWGLLPLRVVLGAVFLMHAAQKILVFGHAGVTDMLAKLGFPIAGFFAVVLMAVELLGGAAILLGIYGRLAAVALAVEMAIAIFVARLGGGFFTPYGYEFELTLCGACLTVALVGTGGVSLDAFLGPRGGGGARVPE